MDFSCHRLWGYYEFQMHFLGCQWGGKMRLASRRFAAAPSRVIASLGGAALSQHQEELLVCIQRGNSSPGNRGPAQDFFMSLHLTPTFPHFLGHGSEALQRQCGAEGRLRNQLDFILWKGDRTFCVQDCHLKSLFPTFSFIILVCRILVFPVLA